MTIRQQLNQEIETASPEMLALLFDFMQLLKKSTRKKAVSKKTTHFLSDSIGVMANERGQNFEAIISKEFQEIEFH